MTTHPRRTAVLQPPESTVRPASAAPGMQPLRECACPDWVEMCAHFEGRWVALHLAPPFYKSWAVCQGAEPPSYLESEQGHDRRGVMGFFGNSKQEALAAFREAEGRLLGREERPAVR